MSETERHGAALERSAPLALCSVCDPASLPISKCTRECVKSGYRLPAIVASFQMLNDHLLAPGAEFIGYEAAQRAVRRVTGGPVGIACI